MGSNMLASPLRLLNLDSTGLRVVKKGCLVEFPGGAVATVKHVRQGTLSTETVPGKLSKTPCNRVRVVV